MAHYDFAPGMIGYSLVRFSTKKQADGTSFWRQVTAAETFCRHNEIILDKSLHDDDIRKLGMSGLSGAHVVKGPLKKFVAGIDNGTVKPGTSLLLVSEWNRLTRQVPSDALKLVIGLMERGIGIVDLQDGAYYTLDRYNADMGLSIGLQVKISAANQYSIGLKHNLTAAWARRREKVRAGEAKATNACPEWLRVGEDGNHHPIGDRIPVIERIIALRHEGLGKHAIASRLGKTPAFRGNNGWAASSVQRLVKNDALRGIYQPRLIDGTPVGDPQPDFYPRIISDDDFWRAQWPITDAKTKVLPDGKVVPINGGRRTNSNLFGQVATTCAVCGTRLHYVNKGSKGGAFLQCGQSRYAGRCSNKTPHKYGVLESETLAVLGKLDFSRLLDTRREPATDRIAALTAEIAETNATLDRLLTDFDSKVPAAVSKRIAVLSEQVETKEAELTTLRRDARIIEAEGARDAFGEFQTLLAALDSDTDRDALRDRIVHELGRIVADMVGDGNVLRLRLHGAGSQHMELQFMDSKFVRVVIVNDSGSLASVGMDSATTGKHVAPAGLARYVAS